MPRGLADGVLYEVSATVYCVARRNNTDAIVREVVAMVEVN
jgi:hypothetical protein